MAKPKLGQLKSQLDKLRRDSLDVVTNANRIVSGGVGKLADKELKALNDYYKSAVASIKKADKSDLKGLALKQIDLLQDAVNQVITHARSSIGIVADARSELAKLVDKSLKGGKVTAAALEDVIEPARKAVIKARTAAAKASDDVGKKAAAAKKSATAKSAGLKRKVAAAEKAVVKNAASNKTAAKSAARKAVKVADRAIPKPSLNSRASLATSKAKRAANSAVETFSAAVSSAAHVVSDAVKPS